MQKIGDSTSTANGAKEFTKGQPGTGVDATVITAEWLNAIQRELVNLVLGGGLALVPGDDSQVLKAIQAIQLTAVTWAKLGGKPTTIGGFGITDAFTKSETAIAIQKAVSDLVASSPAALDTLKELADALGNDPNFATTMTNALASKAAKATTLAGYGITNTYTKDEITAMIAQASSLPVGALIGFPVDKVAPGFLELDGSVKSVATYPDLATFLGGAFNKGDEGAGNFRLPESRGEFLRGWDHGRGVNPGRGIGTLELDMLKSHTHGAKINQAAAGSGYTTIYSTGTQNDTDTYIQFTGGSETRPRNVSVMWCIKAWNAPSNQGGIDVAALAASVAALTPENRRKTSPWVPMSLGGAYTFAHGFGVEPWVSSLEVKCVVATTGFVVGATMVVSVHGSADGGSSSTSSPIGVWHDETNSYARFGAATAVNLTRPTDGVQVPVPFANFLVRLKVEK